MLNCDCACEGNSWWKSASAPWEITLFKMVAKCICMIILLGFASYGSTFVTATITGKWMFSLNCCFVACTKWNFWLSAYFKTRKGTSVEKSGTTCVISLLQSHTAWSGSCIKALIFQKRFKCVSAQRTMFLQLTITVSSSEKILNH